MREDSPTLHWSSITLARLGPSLRLSTRSLTPTHATNVMLLPTSAPIRATCAFRRGLRLPTHLFSRAYPSPISSPWPVD